MKTIGFKWVALFVACVCAVSVSAQSDLTVKVKNIRSAKGKVMIAADKGQYAMVDATGDTATLVLKEVPEGKCKLYVYHDENGNYQLDRVDGVPTENCAIVDLDMTVEAKTIDVELADLRNKAKNNFMEEKDIIMEDKELNEQESLKLITQMIQNTRRNLDTGSGNMFLLWGYVSAIVTLVVFAGIYWTRNPVWMWGFWGVPVLGYLFSFILVRKQRKLAKSYGDKVLNEMWQIMGLLCIAIVLGATFTNHYEIILPICAILISLSSIITGSIIRYTLFSGFPAFGIALGLNMLFSILDKTSSYLSLLEFVLVIVFALIIPGHILNYCAKKDNKR